MIEIKKGREPDKLLRYRQQKGASYEQMDKSVKAELLEKLLQEQGHLCAYCMKRIPEKRELPVGVASVTIEHWFPRNPENKEDVGQGLNYRNMFAVCSGNRGSGCREKMTCDARRGNEAIKVNPCDVRKRHGLGDISLYCRRKLEQIRGIDDPKLPYVGILIWWLEKHI